jgi:neutral ceramidase
MSKVINRRCFLIIAAVACFAWATTSAAADFKVGVGRTVITPQGPIWMSGYASRIHPSEGVVHDLWAKALVIEDSHGGRVVLVTTDVIGLPHELSEDVAARLKAKYGLERSQIVFSASHTHCGPVVWPNLKSMYFVGPEDRDRLVQYGKKLADDLVHTVDAAMADRALAQVSVGHGSAGFTMNRREPAQGGVRLGVNSKGPTDPDVPVLKVASPDGKLRAVLFAYACHNTTLGGDFYKINGDYAGFAECELEKALPGTTAMFAILCGADQNPQPRGKLELAQQHGKTLAKEVLHVLGGRLRPVSGPIRTAYEVTELRFARHDRATFEKEAASPDKYRQARAKLMLAAYDAGRPIRSLPYPVQAVRLGDDLALLALAGEVTVEYALRLKRELPKENLIVMGYANEVRCYIPSLAVLRGGGYEPVDSMIYYGQPGPFAEDVEETVIAACRKVLEQTSRSSVLPARPKGSAF